MSRPAGRFALVLHTHLPYVLRHGRWPHGTDWLCQAVAESYLPLLGAFERLERSGVPARATMSFSPILCEQLEDDAFRTEFTRWIASRRETLRNDLRDAEHNGETGIAGLARHWMIWLDGVERHFGEIDGRIVGAFRRLQDRGALEIATCAATHGYLPLLSRDECVELQLRTAVAAHRRHFGRAPRGIWLPECAYRPRYEWTPPIGREAGRVRTMRAGLEECLAENGLEWFVVDAHLVAAGDPLSIYRNFYPSLASLRGYEERFPEISRTRSPFATYSIVSRGSSPGSGRRAVAFVREPRTSFQVWSRDEGYPGAVDYLEFHRRRIANGPRYWRVTGPTVDMDSKEIYDPVQADARTEEHARHFVWLVGDTLERAVASSNPDPIVCAPFDTELFGHWWFEGPLWLEHLFRHLAAGGISTVTASEEVDRKKERETTTLLEGSWGEGGDHRAWLNRESEWTWDRLYDAESDFSTTIAQIRSGASRADSASAPTMDRATRQALRELLLMQASDWQFLITTGSARDYAERRFATHYVEFKRLMDLVRRLFAGQRVEPEEETFLAAVEQLDRPFPDLDTSWFGAPK